jgi:hypothetical protein
MYRASVPVQGCTLPLPLPYVQYTVCNVAYGIYFSVHGYCDDFGVVLGCLEGLLGKVFYGGVAGD